MKHFLVTALILGCLSAAVIAQSRGTFEFYDHNGQCWRFEEISLQKLFEINFSNFRCDPGLPCTRCSASRNPRLPSVDDTCPIPNCDDPANRPWLFPVAGQIASYWQCMQTGTGTWAPQQFLCPCDTVFHFNEQGCDFPFNVRPFPGYPCRFEDNNNK